MSLFLSKKQKNKEDYFNEIYFKYYKYAYAIALNLVLSHDLVDDVLQDAFIKVYKEINNIDDELTAKAYVSVIVRNTAKNAALKSSKEKSRMVDIEDDVLENTLIDSMADPLENLLVSEGVELIRSGIYELPEKYSSVLGMKYIMKYDTAKIAEILDIKVKTVYVRAERGKALLLKKLNKEEREG